MSELILVLGGARSGKSAFARRLAAEGPTPVLFVATMEPGDDELRRRIERHRRERPPEWRTLEEPLAVVDALRRCDGAPDTVLLDCLTLWVANLLQRSLGDEVAPDAIEAAEADALMQVDALLGWRSESGARLIVVSNEVGLGIVPEYPLGRAFRDILGLAHQRIAAAADRVYFVVAGLANEIKGPAGREGD
ncbi:MAG: bifunctional adenosylcobinamide kinase/adenosylcobinamide-phosphate guanylyltransferase [Dehalococcoidia bacterium]